MKFLSAASLVSSIVLLLQDPATAVPQQRPQGGIEGNVTRLGSGQPVPNARVTVTPRTASGARGAAAPAPIPPVMTDDKGKYTVQGLEDGVYNVQFQANGYVGQRYGRFADGPGTPVTVRGGQLTRDIHVALTPAANIGGRVRDESDQPLVNVTVELLRLSYDYNGRRTYESTGVTRTNDRGEYRMYWVTPGRYYLRAGNYSNGGSPRVATGSLRNDFGASGSDTPSVVGYAFYPAGGTIKNARLIELQPGVDLRSLDVSVITSARTFSIRGKLVDSRTGKAPQTANVFADAQDVGMSPGGPETNRPSLAYKAADGTFEIRDLLPGTYSVVAKIESLPPPGVPEPPLTEASATVAVTVTDSDVNGIALSVAPGLTIAGRMRLEGEPPARLSLDDALVVLTAIGGNGFEVSHEPGFLQADGSFRVSGVVPGEYQFELANIPIETFGFVKEARLNGIDVLNTPLLISGTDNKQLDIVLRVGGGNITGSVNDARSQPVPGARVVLVPDRARFRTDLYRTDFTDQAGHFSFAHLAPGNYKVFSWESIEDNAWLDPEVLGRSEQRGRSARVEESLTETIDVQIIAAEGPR